MHFLTPVAFHTSDPTYGILTFQNATGSSTKEDLIDQSG